MDSANSDTATSLSYYDKFSRVYDIFSPKWYYHKPRYFAVNELDLTENQTVLNVPCGTGQNFEYFQQYLKGSGTIIAIDISDGMLEKARRKKEKLQWSNIQILKGDATKITKSWVESHLNSPVEVNAILCDLGLSGFPEWQLVIDNLIAILEPSGKFVIMDWYIEKPTLRGKFVEWIGKGEVNRPIWQYLKPKVENFKLNHSFKRGGVFVTSGQKP